jgi:galactonate dehydratase
MNRRELLQGAGVAALLPGTSHGKEAARVTITGLDVFRVKVNRRGNWVLFRMNTSAGITGIGDASHGGRDDELVASLGKQFLESMKGRSIFDIEWLRKLTFPVVESRGRPASVAHGGLEQCMWDLQGKALGVPTYKLFGGMLRRKIRNYANINRSTEERSPAGFAAMAERAVNAGLDAVKLAPFDDMPRGDVGAARIEEFTKLGIERAEAVRKVLGPGRDLLLDAHNKMNLERGLDLARRLEPLELFWLEEVSRPLENLTAINKAAKMPTAGGESLFGVKAYFPYIAAGAVDIVMPDIKYCGGMFELKKIAAMAEGAGLLASPHGPASPVGNMAAAHVCATLPNFQILEYSFGEAPWREEVVDPPEEVDNGLLTVPDRPGFGITLNEKTIRAHTP